MGVKHKRMHTKFETKPETKLLTKFETQLRQIRGHQQHVQ